MDEFRHLLILFTGHSSIYPLSGFSAFITVLLISYPVVVFLLRYERINRMQRKYNYPTRVSLSQMTNSEAQEIVAYLAEREFPLTFATAIPFAIFKTYGIPSISSVLVSGGQFADSKFASKRIADTAVLLFEFCFNSPTSERTLTAIARMNYIHSGYQKAGKITNDDLLFTLSLFTLEPVRWIQKYEWRDLTDLELCATGTFWKSLGDAMGISYENLESTKWEDGICWLEQLEEWSLRYEAQYMVPAESNHQLGSATIDLFLFKVPGILKPVGNKIMTTLLEDRLAKAIMFEDPPPIYHQAVSTILKLRKLILRYLCFPRIIPKSIAGIPNPGTGRYWPPLDMLAHPWYAKPTFWRRWGPIALLNNAIGFAVPGDDGETYYPEGYLLTEVGPGYLEGKGGDFMMDTKERLQGENRGGCPFH